LPKRSNAANPLPEPATAFMQFSKAAPFCQWQRSQNAIPLPDANGYMAKAGAALPPPTISPSVLANVIAMTPAAVPGGDATGVLANAIVAKAASLPPGVRAKAASLPPSRAVAPTVYEDMMRRARALDEWNAGLDEPRTYNPHPVSY
jgi:hypothetical protein